MLVHGDFYKIKDKLFFQIHDEALSHLFTPIIILEHGALVNAIALIEENVEEDYEYDYDEHLEYRGIDYHKTYHAVAYSPFDGSRFDFAIDNVIDKTDEYEEILRQEEEWNNYRSSNKKLKALCDLSLQKQNLIGDVLIFEINEDCVFEEENRINWIEVIEGIV